MVVERDTCGGSTVAGGGRYLQEITDQAERQLRTDDAGDVAWGAFLSAQYHLRSAVPLLEAALARGLGNNDAAKRAAELALLDALVQLDARLPAVSVRPYFESSPVQTLILLASASSGRDEVLLPLLNSTSGFRWQAVADLLFATKPPGFAFRLLSGLRLKLVVYASDEEGRAFGSGVGGATEEDGIGTMASAGFPPLAEYQFAVAGPGATVLTVGPRTVYYVRRTPTPPGVVPPLQHSSATSPTAFERVEFINALVRQKFETAPLYPVASPTFMWTNSQEFSRRVTEQRKRFDDSYRNVISLLVMIGQLTLDEVRALTPEIQVTLVDQRRNRSEPLPGVGPGRP